jgi:hypothetical protein
MIWKKNIKKLGYDKPISMLIRAELTWDILLNLQFKLRDWNNLIKKINRIIKLFFY